MLPSPAPRPSAEPAHAAASPAFLDPGEMSDGRLRLVLEARIAPDPRSVWTPAYRFEIRDAGRRVGEIELRLGAAAFVERLSGHVGYEIEPQHRGRRYAARALALLLPLARRHGFGCLWITCDPDNAASRRTCELVGAELVEIVDVPPGCDLYALGHRRKCRYRLRL